MKKGFTLIEMLVVIALIGLLSTLAIVTINSARQKSWCDKKGIKDAERCQIVYDKYLKSTSK